MVLVLSGWDFPRFDTAQKYQWFCREGSAIMLYLMITLTFAGVSRLAFVATSSCQRRCLAAEVRLWLFAGMYNGAMEFASMHGALSAALSIAMRKLQYL